MRKTAIYILYNIQYIIVIQLISKNSIEMVGEENISDCYVCVNSL